MEKDNVQGPDYWQVALEEYKLLQAIVARQSNHIMQIRNWMITVLAGLSFASLSGSMELPPLAIPLIGGLVVLFFFWIERNSERVHQAAITRIRKLEGLFNAAFLQQKVPNLPSGLPDLMVPHIAGSVSNSNKLLFWGIYVGALMLMGLLAAVNFGLHG